MDQFTTNEIVKLLKGEEIVKGNKTYSILIACGSTLQVYTSLNGWENVK